MLYWRAKQDLNKAEYCFQQALEHNPSSAVNVANYLMFLAKARGYKSHPAFDKCHVVGLG